MTTQEFSDAFDTLLNSYGATVPVGEELTKHLPVFDEYEKSLFLTKAQEEIVVSLYTGKNSNGESFESTEEQRRYLSSQIKEGTLHPIDNTDGTPIGISSHSTFFRLPEDLWFITYETVKVNKGRCGETIIMVYPVKQDEYQSLKDNPFRGANDRRALRLDLSEGTVEIVSKDAVSTYYIRYIKKLSPIILTDLPEGLTINKEIKETSCKLHEALHQRILERAVIEALQSKGYSQSKSTRDN